MLTCGITKSDAVCSHTTTSTEQHKNRPCAGSEINRRGLLPPPPRGGHEHDCQVNRQPAEGDGPPVDEHGDHAGKTCVTQKTEQYAVKTHAAEL
jgi:hypothetical protein